MSLKTRALSLLLVVLLPLPALARETGERLPAKPLRQAAFKPAFLRTHGRTYAVETPLERQPHQAVNQGGGDRDRTFAALSVLQGKAYLKDGKQLPALSPTFVEYYLLLSRAEATLRAGQSVTKGKLNLGYPTDRLEREPSFSEIASLVSSRGICPEAQMPATKDADTAHRDRLGVVHAQVAGLLAAAFRDYERINRKAPKGDARTLEAERTAVAEKYRAKIGTLLDATLGKPPATFQLEGKTYSPAAFARDYLRLAEQDLSSLTLTHDPERAWYRKYKDGGQLTFNVPAKAMEQTVRRAVDQGQPVFVTTELSKGVPEQVVEGEKLPAKARGILSLRAFDYKRAGGVATPSRRELVRSELADDPEAAVITGYQPGPKPGQVQRWKVDGSWGKDRGDRGHFHMYNDYFERYVGSVEVHPSALPPELLQRFNSGRTLGGVEPPRKVKRWTTSQRRTLVVELLSGKLTVEKAAERYELPVDVIKKWRDEARTAMRRALHAPATAAGGQP
jgi:bleomycin hydrolase